MACSSTGANTKIGFEKEATYGTVPASPALIELPVASENFATAKDEIVDARLDGSRDVKDVTFGNKQISAELAGDFSADDYDSLIESFMFNTFGTPAEPGPAAGAITIGNEIKSFTMEEAQLDIMKYRKFTGLVANTMAIEAPIDGNATITFGMVGKDEGYDLGGTDADASLDADGYTPAVFNTPFRHVDGVVTEGGINQTALGVVQAVSLSGDNQIDPQFVWGKDTVDCQTAKKVQITGSMTIYYIDETLVNKWIQGESSSLSFSLTDGTNTYTFVMDKIYYTGGDMAVSDDGVRTITLPFRAVDSANTSLKITKA